MASQYISLLYKYNMQKRMDEYVAHLESNNELLFSLVNYLSIRVGITVSQKLSSSSFVDMSNTELKIFKQIYRHILKLFD